MLLLLGCCVILPPDAAATRLLRYPPSRYCCLSAVALSSLQILLPLGCCVVLPPDAAASRLLCYPPSRCCCHSAVVLSSLQILLPLGCCSLVEYSSVYHDSWRCNFLGLRPDTPLPQHTDLYVSLLITEPSKQTDAASPPATDDAFTGYTFTVDSPFVLPNTGA